MRQFLNGDIEAIKKLAAAMIIQALKDYQANRSKSSQDNASWKTDKEKAALYLFGEKDGDDPLSFEMCCCYLDLDPGDIRTAIKTIPNFKWSLEKLKEPP